MNKPKQKFDTNKSKFDTSDFVFKTEISKIEEWLERMLDDLDDPEIPWPNQQEEMFLATWIRDIGYYRANNIKYTLTSAQESAIMGNKEESHKEMT